MTFTLATIVEGEGEVSALPELLRRLEPTWRYPRPIRFPRTKLLKDEGIIKAISIALATIRDGSGSGAVLIMLDADDDCAVELARGRLNAVPEAIRSSTQCVVAVREYEAWLVAGDPDHPYPDDPEARRDAKGVLKQWYGLYKPTADQARFTARCDWDRVRQRCRSFRKLEAALAAIGDIFKSADM